MGALEPGLLLSADEGLHEASLTQYPVKRKIAGRKKNVIYFGFFF